MNIGQKIVSEVTAIAKAVWPFIGQTVDDDAKAIENLAADSLPALKAGLQLAFKTYLEAKLGTQLGDIVEQLAESLADNAIHTLGVTTQGIALTAK